MRKRIKQGDDVLLLNETQSYLVRAQKKSLNIDGGIIHLEELIGKPYGSEVVTHKGRLFVAVEPNTIDLLKKRMRRMPQIIHPKELSLIVGFTGLSRKARVVEAGTGSGYATLFLARHCSNGKVFSYEKRREFYENVKRNLDELGVKNVVLKNRDILEGIDEKGLDLVLLDMKGAERAVPIAHKALKPGGFLVVYSPYIEQVKAVVKEIGGLNFSQTTTMECILRHWDVREHTLPKRSGILHTGFLTLARKVSK